MPTYEEQQAINAAQWNQTYVPPTPVSNYMGVSVVDYLKSINQPSDYVSRATLAAQKGITNYTGTGEQNTQLLGILKGTTPTATNVSLNIPELKVIEDKDAQSALGIPPAQNVLDSTAGYEAYQKAITDQINLLNKQAETQQKQLAESQKTQQSWTEKIGNWFETKPSATDLINQQLKQYQIPEQLKQQSENVSQITAYKTQLADLETQKQQALNFEQNRLAPQGFIMGRMNAIEKDYLIRENNLSMKISALASVNEMIKGNIDQSTSFAKMYIEAATYEDSLELKKMDMFMELNRDTISQLSDAYQNTLTAARDDLQFALTQSQDQAQFEINKQLELARMAQTGTTKVDGDIFSQTQLNKGAATAGIPITDFTNLDQDTQNFFVNNASDIEAKKKIIDTSKNNKEDPTIIEKEISESNLPDAVKDALVKYLWTIFPRPTDKNKQWYEFWK